MENPDLRMAMGMNADQKGVRIRRIDPTSPESAVLKPSDIILSFDGVDIANDGTGKPRASLRAKHLKEAFECYMLYFKKLYMVLLC